MLTFETPDETVPLPADARLDSLQRGTIGDLTASRKVRAFDIPLTEGCQRLKQKQPVTEHMANSLYVEWFSEANGRVVIESADYKLNVSSPAWRPTPEEEQQQRREAAEGFNGFLNKLLLRPDCRLPIHRPFMLNTAHETILAFPLTVLFPGGRLVRCGGCRQRRRHGSEF